MTYFDKIKYINDVDVNNCPLSHEQWAFQLALALMDPEQYKQIIDKEYNELVNMKYKIIR